MAEIWPFAKTKHRKADFGLKVSQKMHLPFDDYKKPAPCDLPYSCP